MIFGGIFAAVLIGVAVVALLLALFIAPLCIWKWVHSTSLEVQQSNRLLRELVNTTAELSAKIDAVEFEEVDPCIDQDERRDVLRESTRLPQ